MWVIGLTGGSGAGKSTVSQMLEKHGFTRVDVDQLAKDLYLPGQAAHPLIKKAFGRACVGWDGKIDRQWLREKVFSDAKQLKKLNAILVPLIKREIKRRLETMKRQGIKRAALDMAILLNAKAESLVDDVIYVQAPLRQRIERLIQRGVPPAMARKQASALKLGARELARVHFTLHNSRDLKRTEASLERYLKKREKILYAA